MIHKPKRRGVLMVVSGPSGAGKGTLCTELRKLHPELKLSVSVTTRAPREGEVDGVHYFFKTRQEFEALRDNGRLLEWAEVYGNCYGTPLDFVKDTLDAGGDMLLEIDIQGALNVKRMLPEATLVFLIPPSLEILRQRLTDRGTESPEALARRIASVEAELPFMEQYDYLVINDDLDAATADTASIYTAQTKRMELFSSAYQLLTEGKTL